MTDKLPEGAATDDRIADLLAWANSTDDRICGKAEVRDLVARILHDGERIVTAAKALCALTGTDESLAELSSQVEVVGKMLAMKDAVIAELERLVRDQETARDAGQEILAKWRQRAEDAGAKVKGWAKSQAREIARLQGERDEARKALRDYTDTIRNIDAEGEIHRKLELEENAKLRAALEELVGPDWRMAYERAVALKAKHMRDVEARGTDDD